MSAAEVTPGMRGEMRCIRGVNRVDDLCARVSVGRWITGRPDDGIEPLFEQIEMDTSSRDGYLFSRWIPLFKAVYGVWIFLRSVDTLGYLCPLSGGDLWAGDPWAGDPWAGDP
jgi:hypothetical protein